MRARAENKREEDDGGTHQKYLRFNTRYCGMSHVLSDGTVECGESSEAYRRVESVVKLAGEKNPVTQSVR